MGLNSKWQVYPDPTFGPHFFRGQTVMWLGGKRDEKRLGVITAIEFYRRNPNIRWYIVRVLNRPSHGGQRVQRLRPGTFEHASIIDQVGDLGRTDGGGTDVRGRVQDR